MSKAKQSKGNPINNVYLCEVLWFELFILSEYASDVTASWPQYSPPHKDSVCLFVFNLQVSDWWEEYVYLRSRSPIMVNSNYYGMV